MKLYVKVVAFFVFLFGMVGLVLPFLISYNSTEAVILGGFFIVVSPLIVYLYVRNIIFNKPKQENL